MSKNLKKALVDLIMYSAFEKIEQIAQNNKITPPTNREDPRNSEEYLKIFFKKNNIPQTETQNSKQQF